MQATLRRIDVQRTCTLKLRVRRRLIRLVLCRKQQWTPGEERKWYVPRGGSGTDIMDSDSTGPCGVWYPEVASFAKWTPLYALSHLMSKMVNGTVGGTMSSFLKLLTNDVGQT